MGTQFNLVTNIPSILAIECLRNWLLLVDVCLLDSACCCRKERKVLLALFGSPEFVVMQETNMDDDNLIKWLRMRSIRVRNITIQKDREGAEVSKYLNLFGMHMRRVEYFTGYEEAPCTIIFNAITAYCHHLTALTCLQDNQLLALGYLVVENIILNNPDLELLELNGVDLDGRVMQEIALPKLKHLTLTHSYLSKALCEALSASLAPQLERLDLSYTKMEDDKEIQLLIWRSFRNLRALQLVVTDFMSDQHLHCIALNCSHLIHLCLDDCTHITDIGMHDIAMNLAQLRSLDIRGCDDLTDQTMHYLTQYSAVHLHTLYFDTWSFSSAAISNLFKHSCDLFQVGIFINTVEFFPVKEWGTIFKEAPAISVLILDLENLSDVPLDFLAQHCRQLKKLHIITDSGANITSSEHQALLSMLGESPNLQELKILPDLYNRLVNTVNNMYPHLQVVKSSDYPYFDALAQPI